MANIHDLGFPFTSVAGDRQYSASEWREYFDALVTSGVVGEYANQLEIKPQSVPNKTVYIDTGAILIKGALRSITSVVNLSIADNTSGNPRIDRIVARLNYTDRKIEFVVKQGTPAGSPTAPTLTQNSTHWELSLARIVVANGFSTIMSGDISDERGDSSVCGYYEYRAKLMGQIPVEAWVYTNFKSQLTAGEIASIESNSSLMAIINAHTIYNLPAIKYFGKYCEMSGGSALSGTNGILTFSTESMDEFAAINIGTSSSRIVIPSGITRARFYWKGVLNSVSFSGAYGSRIYLYKNGSQQQLICENDLAATGKLHGLFYSTPVSVSAGDYFEVYGSCDTDGGSNKGSISSGSLFGMEVLL